MKAEKVRDNKKLTFFEKLEILIDMPEFADDEDMVVSFLSSGEHKLEDIYDSDYPEDLPDNDPWIIICSCEDYPCCGC